MTSPLMRPLRVSMTAFCPTSMSFAWVSGIRSTALSLPGSTRRASVVPDWAHCPTSSGSSCRMPCAPASTFIERTRPRWNRNTSLPRPALARFGPRARGAPCWWTWGELNSRLTLKILLGAADHLVQDQKPGVHPGGDRCELVDPRAEAALDPCTLLDTSCTPSYTKSPSLDKGTPGESRGRKATGPRRLRDAAR